MAFSLPVFLTEEVVELLERAISAPDTATEEVSKLLFIYTQVACSLQLHSVIALY